MHHKFAEIGDVERLLRIAKKHLDYIKKSKSKEIRIPGPKPDHALIASLCSAIAVETALNVFISTPVLYIKDMRLRSFFGTMVTQYMRLSIPSKLKFVAEFSPGMDEQKKLLKRVDELFKYRNSVAHSSMRYGEMLIPTQNTPIVSEFDSQDIVTEPFLLAWGEGDNEIRLAAAHYRTANEFLLNLRFFEPSIADKSDRDKIQRRLFFVQREEAE